MHRLFLLFTCLLSSLFISASAQLKPGSTTYVWLLEGVKLYNHPSLSSKIIKVIPYGKQVVFNEQLNAATMTLKNTTIHKSSALKGCWSKITVDGKQGYVFDGFLSTMPSLKVKAGGCEQMEDYFGRNYGIPKVTNVKRNHKKTYQYTNGVVLVESNSDGCFNEDITLKNISYREIWLFTRIYTYMADAMGDLTIKKIGENTYRISSYSCD